LALVLPAGAVPAAAGGEQKEVVLAASDGSVHYFSAKANDSASPGGTNWNNDGATGYSAVAIGRKGHAIGDFSVALGHDSHAAGEGGISIGRMSDGQDYRYQGALGNDSIAIGSGSKVETDSGVAIGANSHSGSESVALGKGAKAYSRGAVALGGGTSATASAGNSVAIGSFSAANRGAFTTETEAPFSKFKLNGTNTLGAVSVAGSGKLRQIINLADGTEDADAVNLRQLRAVADIAAGAAAGSTYTIGADPAGADAGIVLDSSNKRLDIVPDGSIITTAVVGRTVKIGVDMDMDKLDLSSRFTISDNAAIPGTHTVELGKNKNPEVKFVGANSVITTVASGVVTIGLDPDASQGGKWNLQTNGEPPIIVAKNDTVQFKNGSNIEITRDERDVTVRVVDAQPSPAKSPPKASTPPATRSRTSARSIPRCRR